MSETQRSALPAYRAPDDLYPRLFRWLETSAGTIDKKLIADAVPLVDAAVIEAEVERHERTDSTALHGLLRTWFELPTAAVGDAATSNRPLEERIGCLWRDLTRHAVDQTTSPSIIALPNPYVVPGGMFRESYYWDTYFILLGLRENPELARGLVDNLAYLIDRFGFVPNGNRTYYLSRSQPPLFYLAAVRSGVGAPSDCWAHYLPQLVAEHAFWMEGAGGLAPGHASRRAVRMSDGALLNRYYDNDPRPRPESSGGRDTAIARRAGHRLPDDVFRDIRAACESGWDFSSRWLGDRSRMETIRTTQIIPADLNAFLFGLENAIAEGARRRGERRLTEKFSNMAKSRRDAMARWQWNEALGLFDDRDIECGLRGAVTAASLVPLFAGVATDDQARRTADRARAELLAAGGLLTTSVETSEQWDAPNGWAPLQWLAVIGLQRYGQSELADAILVRFLGAVQKVYAQSGRLTEKYNVMKCVPGGGGEYPLQDGFGWTNGVVMAMLEHDSRR